MHTRLIHPGESSWGDCLADLPHDVYHVPEYVQLCADQAQAEPLAFVAEEGHSRVFVPLIIRPVNDATATAGGLYDASSPYGYPSPLVGGDDTGKQCADFFGRAIRMLVSRLRERGVVSVFLRLHPLLPIPLEALRRCGALVDHGQTVYVDLTQSTDEIWSQTRRSHRKCIRRAERNGYVAEIDHAWHHFEDFFSIYGETMERVSATDSYFFPREYFLELREALQDALHLCIVRREDTVAAASLYTEVRGFVQAHLGGARTAHGKHAPTILSEHFMRGWAKDRGNHTFHLGGGKGASNDSLFQFKAGFSKLRADYFTFRAVADADAYRRLVSRWEQEAGTSADCLEGFFPAFRRPLDVPGRVSQHANARGVV